jgi:hypothetical protein
MGSHIPFEYLNTSYGKKKGWKSKCQFDSRRVKVKNHPDLLMCEWCVTYHWKTLDEGYNFALDFISIKGLDKKVMGLQSCKTRVTTLHQTSPQLEVLTKNYGPPKLQNEAYNFTSDLTSIGGFDKKLWASKVTRILILGISWQNDIGV